MRSDLIYGALTHISNRYQLCQLASKATRKLHKPNTRLQDTTNEVLVRFHEASPMGMNGDVKVASEQVSQQRRPASARPFAAASRLTVPATPFLNYTLPSIIDLPPNLPPQVNCDYRRTKRKKYY